MIAVDCFVGYSLAARTKEEILGTLHIKFDTKLI